MKKLLKVAAAVIMAAVLVAGVHVPVASAASKVVIHAQDGQNWGGLNVYEWGATSGELAGAWPGSAMEAEEAAGWYTYTIESEEDINLVFCAAAGAPQSSNVEGVSKDAGEIWVVIGGAGEANDMGAATNEAVMYTEPEEGWPTLAAATEVVAEDTAEATVEAEEPAAEDAAAADLPKTGESSSLLTVTLMGLAAVSAVIAAVYKKKEQANEN